MKYNQKIGKFFKSELDIELLETGFDYVFTDNLLFSKPRTEKAFIPYTNISNQKEFVTRNHPDSRKIIFTLVAIFIIGLIIVVSTSVNWVYGSPYERYYTAGFYIAIIAVFFIYKFTAVQKVIKVFEHSGGSFLILNEREGEKIIGEIITYRNKYMRDKFISKDNYKALSIESVEYLASLEVISKEEANEIKEKIRPNTGEAMGFDQKEVTL
jgi:hypothetical protein